MKRIAFLLLFGLLFSVSPESDTYTYTLYLPGVFATSTQRGVAKTVYGDCTDLSSVGATWYYSWGLSPPICPGIEALPMISCDVAAEWVINGTRLLGHSSEWVMLFNEPDLIRPISSRRGAELTHALLPFLEGRKVLSPAPSEGGLTWLPAYRQWYIDLYGRPPPMDALAVHCYNNTSAQCIALAEQVIGWAVEWGVPEVWVTEFAFFDSSAMGEAQSFIRWMTQEPMITRYAWYTNRLLPDKWGATSTLLEFDTGALTPRGPMYRE